MLLQETPPGGIVNCTVLFQYAANYVDCAVRGDVNRGHCNEDCVVTEWLMGRWDARRQKKRCSNVNGNLHFYMGNMNVMNNFYFI